MKILQIHNKYKIHGGEDEMQINEKKILSQNNHNVLTLLRDNKNIRNLVDIIKIIKNINFNYKNYVEIKEQINKLKPNLVHVYNYFPIWTASIFKAIFECKIPLVLSVGNYRMFCSNGLMFRNNHLCDKCLVGSRFNSIIHKCYRNSYLQSYFVSRMIEHNLRKNVFNKYVSGFIVNHEFVKEKLLKLKIDKEKIFIKPNLINNHDDFIKKKDENYALYVGRISNEKGIYDLIKKWQNINFKLIVIGGHENEKSNKLLFQNKNIEFVGFKKRDEINDYYRKASFLIFPSLCNEAGIPLTFLEALNSELPILASNRYPQKEIIKNNFNGYIYEINSDVDFSEKVQKLINSSSLRKEFGKNSKKLYLKNYDYNQSYQRLLEVYETIIDRSK